MALAVDREYRHRVLTRAHLIAEGEAWGLSDAERIIDNTLATVSDVVATEMPHPSAHPALVADIARFTDNLIAGRAAGDPAETGEA